MVFCKNCKSINVKVANANFASVKPEGQPSAKQSENKFFFHCWNCESDWESNQEAYQDYYEYDALRGRTTMVAHDMKPGMKIEAQYIDSNELMRRHELAKKIISSYKHLLDLKPGEWYDIEQDVR
jgi:hypothetical protein